MVLDTQLLDTQLLDPDRWTNRIFVGGSWTEATGGSRDVVAPATGAVLGRVGVGDAKDLARAAESAAAAQRAWAATPHPERAAVLRRAAQLWSEHAEEISWWNVREVGAIPPMAGFALHVAEEIFGPVAPVLRFTDVEDAVRIAADTEYGLSLGIVTRDPMRGLALADRVPSGIVHINDQTVGDEANAPFGGVGASGTGSRFGGAAANIEAFTETRWVTMRSQAPTYPY